MKQLDERKNAGDEVAIACLFGYFNKDKPLTKDNLPRVLCNMGGEGCSPRCCL